MAVLVLASAMENPARAIVMPTPPPEAQTSEERAIGPNEMNHFGCFLPLQKNYLSEVGGRIVREQSSFSPKFGYVRRVIFEMNVEFQGKTRSTLGTLVIWGTGCEKLEIAVF